MARQIASRCGWLLFVFLCLPCLLYGQNGHYTGRVVDTDGRPLAGVNLRWADTTVGTSTDADGLFSVAPPPAGVLRLRVSGVGFETKEVMVPAEPGWLGDIVLATRRTEMGALVVTATRNQRSLEAIPLPVTVVGETQIRNTGAMRLNDILAEQMGMTIVSDHGTGLQMQGFDPEYTLVLIDGEPVIGRSAGTLDLTRIALGNVQQIEIVKGPSSSLYGSDALAGVVNIITRQDSSPFAGFVSSSLATNGVLDTGAEVRVNQGPLSAVAFGNFNRSDGYDLSPETRYATISKFRNYTLRGRVSYDISPDVEFKIGTRYFDERARNQDAFATADRPVSDVRYFSRQSDWSLTPELTANLRPGMKLALRQNLSGYYTRTYYEYESDGAAFERSVFDQRYGRSEAQVDYALNRSHLVTLGTGLIRETLEADRYNGRKNLMTTYYLFGQHEWQPTDRLNVITGFRFDSPNTYTQRLSPRLAASWKLGGGFLARASVGAGFKAPDFRQLFLNFLNPSVGYTVLGTVDAAPELRRMVENGVVAPEDIYVDLNSLADIRPENSRSLNIGGEWKQDFISVSANLFYNDVHDLIDTRIVAVRTNGNSIYSYVNLNRVQMRGLESSLSVQPLEGFEIGLGYQYLDTRDVDRYNAVKEGKVFRRNPTTGATERVPLSDYGGLPNRSRHSGTVKLAYTHAPAGFTASVRGMLRGRFGLMDLNSNSIIDTDAEYAEAHALWNVTVSKDLPRSLSIFAGVNNLTGYTNPQAIPSLPGRIFQGGLRIQFSR